MVQDSQLPFPIPPQGLSSFVLNDQTKEVSGSPLARSRGPTSAHTSALLKAQGIQRHVADPDIDAEEELEAVSDDAIALGLQAHVARRRRSTLFNAN